jgi:OOP family OmpA-OmpF porin
LKNKLKYILVLLLGFGYYNSNSQNLIANGSFENYTSPIDCGAGGFANYSTFPVNHVVDNWYGYNSPDYFISLCSNGPLPNQYGFDVPANIFGYSLAKNNNSYIGISVFQANNSEYKEYIYQQLLSPLQMGKIYCLSFYISKADRKEYAVKNIGAYICNTLPSMVSNMHINAIPQVVNTNGFVSDTTQWTEIQGCFIVNGGEQYIIIGNFNSNVNTDTLYTGTNNPISGDPQYSYYYIDDITLIDQSTVGLNEFDAGKSFKIYPNPNNGMMQLSYSITEKAEFVLTDITGRIINSYTLDESRKSIDIKEQELKAGIYFYTVKQSNRILKQDKIVIIK